MSPPFLLPDIVETGVVGDLRNAVDVHQLPPLAAELQGLIAYDGLEVVSEAAVRGVVVEGDLRRHFVEVVFPEDVLLEDLAHDQLHQLLVFVAVQPAVPSAQEDQWPIGHVELVPGDLVSGAHPRQQGFLGGECHVLLQFVEERTRMVPDAACRFHLLTTAGTAVSYTTTLLFGLVRELQGGHDGLELRPALEEGLFAGGQRDGEALVLQAKEVVVDAGAGRMGQVNEHAGASRKRQPLEVVDFGVEAEFPLEQLLHANTQFVVGGLHQLLPGHRNALDGDVVGILRVIVADDVVAAQFHHCGEELHPLFLQFGERLVIVDFLQPLPRRLTGKDLPFHGNRHFDAQVVVPVWLGLLPGDVVWGTRAEMPDADA